MLGAINPPSNKLSKSTVIFPPSKGLIGVSLTLQPYPVNPSQLLTPSTFIKGLVEEFGSVVPVNNSLDA